MTARELLILQLLAAGGREMFGLQLIEASGGRLKRGTIYVLLTRLEERSMVASRPEEDPREEWMLPRRLYRITEGGRRTLADAENARLAVE